MHHNAKPAPALHQVGAEVAEYTQLSQSGQPKRRRAAHTKSRNGCSNCVRRHVKCDESQPSCSHCQARGEICTLQGPRAVRPRQRASRFLVSTPTKFYMASVRDETDRRAFEYFNFGTLPVFRNCQPSILWGRTLGWIVQSNAAIRKIAIALGSQHRLLSSQNQTPVLLEQAEKSYALALGSLRKSVDVRREEGAFHSMFSCLLMTVLESLRGAHEQMLIHLRSGMTIAIELADSLGHHGEASFVVTALLNYCLHSWIYAGVPWTQANPNVALLAESIPWSKGALEKFQRDDNLLLDVLINSTDFVQTRPRLSQEHSSAAFAQLCNIRMHGIRLRHSIELSQGCSPEQSLRYNYMLALSHVIETSLDYWLGLNDTEGAEEPGHFEVAVDALGVVLSEHEASDHVRVDEQSSFSLGLGIAQLLENVIMCCGQREVRVNALKVLDRCPRIEGLWNRDQTRAYCRSSEELVADIDALRT